MHLSCILIKKNWYFIKLADKIYLARKEFEEQWPQKYFLYGDFSFLLMSIFILKSR